MIYSKEIAAQSAAYLLQINAIKLSPQAPFTWASGMKSPIYSDNRLTLSYPDIRQYIKKSFAQIVQVQYPEAQKIAGVATAGIAHGALLADELKLPFVYVRSAPKAHGMGNLIEGKVEKGEKILVIEDLISTGGSSLQVVKALREEGCEVLALGAIFTYGFQKAVTAFNEANCPFFTLTDYPSMLEKAIETGYIKDSDKQSLLKWYQSPENWKP